MLPSIEKLIRYIIITRSAHHWRNINDRQKMTVIHMWW